MEVTGVAHQDIVRQHAEGVRRGERQFLDLKRLQRRDIVVRYASLQVRLQVPDAIYHALLELPRLHACVAYVQERGCNPRPKLCISLRRRETSDRIAIGDYFSSNRSEAGTD